MTKGIYKRTEKHREINKQSMLKVTKLNKGKKRPPFSKEWRQKMSDSQKKKIVSEQTKAKLRRWTKEKRYNWKGGYENKLYLNRQRLLTKKNAMGAHTLIEWQNLKRKYNYMCLCCKQFEPEITLSVDHIVPLSKGGSDFITNIQPLCRSCNSRKYDKIINFVKNYAIFK